MDNNELNQWLKELADVWPSHEESVKATIASVVEKEDVGPKNSEYYLGYIQGMLACGERIKGVLDGMDESQKAVYYSIMKYCAFRYVEESNKA